MYKIYLSYNFFPKSLNSKLRSHRFANHKENKKWDIIVKLDAEKFGLPDRPLERAKISIIRHNYRMLDYDGLVGSMKPVVDALVSAGVLLDDSWNVLGQWNVSQKFRTKAQGQLLEILVQEMPYKPF